MMSSIARAQILRLRAAQFDADFICCAVSIAQPQDRLQENIDPAGGDRLAHGLELWIDRDGIRFHCNRRDLRRNEQPAVLRME